MVGLRAIPVGFVNEEVFDHPLQWSIDNVAGTIVAKRAFSLSLGREVEVNIHQALRAAAWWIFTSTSRPFRLGLGLGTAARWMFTSTCAALTPTNLTLVTIPTNYSSLARETCYWPSHQFFCKNRRGEYILEQLLGVNSLVTKFVVSMMHFY